MRISLDETIATCPVLPDSGVVLYSFDGAVAAARLGELIDFLEPEDHQRAAKGKRGAPWLATRAVVRAVLGSILRCRPQFSTVGDGKPTVDGLAFNLSHSRDAVVLAVARGGNLGVDIESAHGARPVDRLARRFFSPTEQQCLAATPPGAQRVRLFAALWARKESLLKASGTGLVYPLQQWDVASLPNAATTRLSGTPWYVADLPAPDGFAAALAWDHPISISAQYELEL